METSAPTHTSGMPLMLPHEQRTARALDNVNLAQRLDALRINRRAFDKKEADAYLQEAARRLRWSDAYAAHS
jgi:hypothetical protein